MEATRDLDAAPISRSRLWFALLAAPVAWLVHLTAAAGLVPISCERDTDLFLHATTLITALVAAAGIVVSLRIRRDRGDIRGVADFMSRAGLWMGVLFLALILIEQIPVFTVDACR